MNAKMNICLFLFVYMSFLLPGPVYSFFALCNTTVGLIITTAAQFFFIRFLQSRPPAQKTILNRQLVINFCFKSVFAVYSFALSAVGYIELEALRKNALFTYSTSRIMVTLSLLIYVQVSSSRTLVFFSPTTFRSINVSLFQTISILSILAVFSAEVFISQVILSPDKCDITISSSEIHSLPFTVEEESNITFFSRSINSTLKTMATRNTENDFQTQLFVNTSHSPHEVIADGNNSYTTQTLLFANSSTSSVEANLGEVKTCKLFPTPAIFILILLVLETTRVVMAVSRNIKKISKKKRVSPHIALDLVKPVKHTLERGASVPSSMGANIEQEDVENTRRLVRESFQNKTSLHIFLDNKIYKNAEKMENKKS